MTLPKLIKSITVEDVDFNIERMYVQGDRIIVHYVKANNIATADDVDTESSHWVRIGATQTTINIVSEGRNVIAKVHLSATAFELVIVPAITDEPITEYNFRD